MNKGLIIAIVLVVLVVGAGALLLSRNQSTSTPAAPSSQSNSEQTVNGESFSGNLLSLLSSGQSYTCTFGGADESGNEFNGIVYVASGNKLSGEFSMVQPGGEPVQSNVIRDGTYNYIWSDLLEDGLKTKIEEGDTSIFGGDSASDISTGLSDTENYHFNCNPGVSDNSMFIPPTNINFVDLSEQMMMIQEKNEAALEGKCDACDQIPAGDAQNQCLQALGC